MSEVKYYHVTDAGLREGTALGRITVVLASDFDSATSLFLDATERCLAAERRNAELERDASRWNAFINCARIKFFGWAGYEEKDPYGNSPGNYRHFGGEFWSMHTAPTADKEKAKSILNGFADAAIAAAQPTESGASEPQCCDRFPKCVCHEGADGL